MKICHKLRGFLSRRDVTLAFAVWGCLCSVYLEDLAAVLGWVFAICVALSWPVRVSHVDSQYQAAQPPSASAVESQ